MDKYEVLSQIGDGTFGSVAKAVVKKTGQLVAIKKMKQKYYTWEECTQLPEVDVVRRIHGHPNIVKLREVIRENNELFFVFEYMDGDMLGVIRRAKQAQCAEDAATAPALPYATVRHYMRQLLQALAYLHKRGYFHRDLKPENLLVRREDSSNNGSNNSNNSGIGNEVVKLGDFGLVKEARARPPFTDYVSTRWYRAPELLLQDRAYTCAVDVWAAGCMMAELITTRPLFPGSNEVDQLHKIMHVLGSPTEATWPGGMHLARKIHYTFPSVRGVGLAAVLPRHMPPAALDVLTQMLCYDPRRRVTAEQCLQHPFFRTTSEEAVTSTTRAQLAAAVRRLQNTPQSAPAGAVPQNSGADATSGPLAASSSCYDSDTHTTTAAAPAPPLAASSLPALMSTTTTTVTQSNSNGHDDGVTTRPPLSLLPSQVRHGGHGTSATSAKEGGGSSSNDNSISLHGDKGGSGVASVRNSKDNNNNKSKSKNKSNDKDGEDEGDDAVRRSSDVAPALRRPSLERNIHAPAMKLRNVRRESLRKQHGSAANSNHSGSNGYARPPLAHLLPTLDTASIVASNKSNSNNSSNDNTDNNKGSKGVCHGEGASAYAACGNDSSNGNTSTATSRASLSAALGGSGGGVHSGSNGTTTTTNNNSSSSNSTSAVRHGKLSAMHEPRTSMSSTTTTSAAAAAASALLLPTLHSNNNNNNNVSNKTTMTALYTLPQLDDAVQHSLHAPVAPLPPPPALPPPSYPTARKHSTSMTLPSPYSTRRTSGAANAATAANSVSNSSNNKGNATTTTSNNAVNGSTSVKVHLDLERLVEEFANEVSLLGMNVQRQPSLSQPPADAPSQPQSTTLTALSPRQQQQQQQQGSLPQLEARGERASLSNGTLHGTLTNYSRSMLHDSKLPSSTPTPTAMNTAIHNKSSKLTSTSTTTSTLPLGAAAALLRNTRHSKVRTSLLGASGLSMDHLDGGGGGTTTTTTATASLRRGSKPLTTTRALQPLPHALQTSSSTSMSPASALAQEQQQQQQQQHASPSTLTPSMRTVLAKHRTSGFTFR